MKNLLKKFPLVHFCYCDKHHDPDYIIYGFLE